MVFQAGKLPHDFLKKMIRYSGSSDKRVLLGSKIGEDAAVIDFGTDCLILKTDPITYTVNEIGWYAVHINANDIATMGAKPRWMQTDILLPMGMSKKEIENIFKQIDSACKQLGIAITGGHTEVNPWLDRPIVVGDMHGICKKKDLVFTSGAKIGDSIILTKGAGIEGTATIAREKRDHLRREFSMTFLRRAENYLFDPGISVVEEAMIGVRYRTNSMHDPTEGGVAIGLYEMAVAASKGVMIDRDEILVGKETQNLCDFLGLDPLGLLGSGALLLSMPSKNVDGYLDALLDKGIKAAEIGKVTKKSDGLRIRENGRTKDLKYSQRDEILKVL